MKKVVYILFLLILACTSCSDRDNDITDLPDNNETPLPNPYKTGKDLSLSASVTWDRKGMDDKYFMLGYGYDATGKYAHPASVRNKVLNLEEYIKDEGPVLFSRSTSSGPDLFIGGTQRECIEDLGGKAGFSAGEISRYRNLFKGKFDSPFKNDTSFPGLSYQYHGVSQINVVYHLSFLYSSYRQELFQSRYLTDNFKADLESKSAGEILKIYGTHILSSILIGERIDYLYRYAGDEKSNSSDWFLYNIHHYFSQGPTTWTDGPKKDAPLKENMYIEVIDGTRPDPNSWMIDITNFKGERIVFDGWKNITDNNNLTLVNFRNDRGLIPIYEFVKDPAKREALTKAYQEYLSE